MAVLGNSFTHSEVQTQIDFQSSPLRQTFRYDVDGSTTSDEWQRFGILIPDEILNALVESVTVQGVEANTLHVVDAKEVATMQPTGPSNSSGYEGVWVSEPIMDSTIDGATVAPDCWVAHWPFIKQYGLRVTSKQVVRFFVPPADDHGSPTANYRVYLTLRVLEKTKK